MRVHRGFHSYLEVVSGGFVSVEEAKSHPRDLNQHFETHEKCTLSHLGKEAENIATVSLYKNS